jgi:citrate lyase subunit beta/citryl-CoA lyase
VHPSQVPILNEEFAPSAAEVAHAEAVIAAYESQMSSGKAAFSFNGRMVDLPVVDQARQIVRRHQAVQAQ